MSDSPRLSPVEAAAMVIYEHRRTVDMPMWSEIADKRTNLGAVLATLDARDALTAAVENLTDDAIEQIVGLSDDHALDRRALLRVLTRED